MIRIHNGVAEALETKDNGDGTITFMTDKFSTYAIAYIEGTVEDLPVVEDVPKVEPDTQQPAEPAPAENDGNGMAIVGLLAVLLLAVGVFLVIKKKNAAE